MANHKFSVLYITESNPAARGLICAVWHRILADKLLAKLFYDGSVHDEDGFAAEILRPGCLPFVVMGDGEIASLAWLNCIAGKSAKTHFVIFRSFWGRAMHGCIGRNLFPYILTRKDKDGYLFDCLYGVTPKSNALAWKAALDCGWKMSGEIPCACYMAENGRSESGVVTYATRKSLGIDDGAEWSSRWES